MLNRDAEGELMPWSTTELANLAGTTVNTVRHYHRLGLLDMPQRAANGYKEYTTDHLVRLLQIRRLRDVGVPLARIEVIDGQIGTTEEVLRARDEELEASIRQSQAARADIAEMLEHEAIGGVPEGFAPVAARLLDSERALTLIFSQLYNEEGMRDLRALVESSAGSDPSRDFETLPEDADEATRAELATRLAEPIAAAFRDYPWMAEKSAQPRRRSASFTGAAITESLWEIYNEAQRDVLIRAVALAQETDKP